MFASHMPGSVSLAAASTPFLSASPAVANTSAPNTSRTRRGLSYLRNYTQQHLLSRENTSNNNTHDSASCPSHGLTSAISQHPTTANATTLNTPAASHRFTLVPTASRPLQILANSTSEVEASSLLTASPSRFVQATHSSFVQASQPSTVVTTTQEAEPPGRGTMVRSTSVVTGAAMATTHSNDAAENGNIGVLPSIRLSVFVDPRSQRPSLHFPPIARTLPTATETIRVGRYSERDSQPAVPSNVPSAAPIGFKSKVVSRRHCEFWHEDGKWYIKDVKSSSGTFLNHIRLSPPGQESKPFPVNDGDVVQLGIDFKGGEEMIFRCVKMRLELNRGWQNKLNKFNMNSHKRLWNMTRSEGEGQNYSQDCSICLNSIAPCQCLFVAPCSHTWHYKCIRSLLSSPHYPIFICPNCRAAADLEAEVEDPEDWEQLENELDGKDGEKTEGDRPKEPRLDLGPMDIPQTSMDRIRTSLERARANAAERARSSLERSRSKADLSVATASGLEISMGNPAEESAIDAEPAPSEGGVSAPSTTGLARSIQNGFHATSEPVPINGRRTPSPNSGVALAANGHEGPITPRNDAGPWVFDGSGPRIGMIPNAGARQSLNGVVDMDIDD